MLNQYQNILNEKIFEEKIGRNVGDLLSLAYPLSYCKGYALPAY